MARNIILFIFSLVLIQFFPFNATALENNRKNDVTLGFPIQIGSIFPLNYNSYLIQPELFSKMNIKLNAGINIEQIFPHWQEAYLHTGFSLSGINLKNNNDVRFNNLNWNIGIGVNRPILGICAYDLNLNAGINWIYFKDFTAGFPRFSMSLNSSFLFNIVYFLDAGINIDYSVLFDYPEIFSCINAGIVFKVNFVPKYLDYEVYVDYILYPAKKNYYSKYQVGKVRIENIYTKAINIRNIQITINGLMDNPTNNEFNKLLKPGTRKDFYLLADFNSKSFFNRGKSTVEANIVINYTIENKEENLKTAKTEKKFIFEEKNAITWGDPGVIGAFIYYNNLPIKQFAVRITDDAMELAGKYPVYTKEILSAAAVYEALDQLDFRYISDSNAPVIDDFIFYNISPDFILYPPETISMRGGDCDDLTALYCTLLENLGIETGVLVLKQHIIPVFNTGIPLEAEPLPLQIDDLVDNAGTLWLPVEIACIGNQPGNNKYSFYAAITNAIANIKAYVEIQAKNNFPAIDSYRTMKMWERYDKVEYSFDVEFPGKPDKDRLMAALEADYACYVNEYLSIAPPGENSK